LQRKQKNKKELKNPGFDWGRTSIFLIQTLLIPFSYYIAFQLRFDFNLPYEQLENLVKTLPVIVVVRLVVFYYMGLFDGWWRYVSIEDISKIAAGVAVSAICF